MKGYDEFLEWKMEKAQKMDNEIQEKQSLWNMILFWYVCVCKFSVTGISPWWNIYINQ